MRADPHLPKDMSPSQAWKPFLNVQQCLVSPKAFLLCMPGEAARAVEGLTSSDQLVMTAKKCDLLRKQQVPSLEISA